MEIEFFVQNVIFEWVQLYIGPYFRREYFYTTSKSRHRQVDIFLILSTRARGIEMFKDNVIGFCFYPPIKCSREELSSYLLILRK